MHKKTLSILLLIIGLLSAEPTIHAMNNSFSWRKALSSAKPKNLPVYCVILVIAGLFQDVPELTESNISTENQYDRSDPVAEFVRSTLQEHGIEQNAIDTIKIKKGNQWAARASNILYTHDAFMRQLLSFDGDSIPVRFKPWNQEPVIAEYTKKELFDLSKIAILHEYGHIANKDNVKTPYIMGSLWTSIAYLLEKPMHHLLTQKNIPNKFAEPLHVMMSGLIMWPLFMGYRKYQEYKADMVAIDLCHDAPMLENIAKCFLLTHESLDLPQMNKSHEKYYQNNTAFRELYYGFNNVIDDHPSNLTRANYFKAAAESLKATR